MPPIAARNPVVLFANGIGDHVLAMPALRAIARAFAGRLTLVCANGAPRFLFDELGLERLITLDFRSQNNTKEFDFDLLGSRLPACDLFLSLVPWSSASMSRLLARLPGAASIGFASDFQIRVPRRQPDHMVDVAFRVAQAIRPELQVTDYASPLRLPPDSLAEARDLREQLFGSKRVLLVHADSAQKRKMLHPERLKAILRRFRDSHPDFAIGLVGTSSGSFTDSHGDDRVIRVYDRLLPTAFALVSQAELFLGVDSCMLHVADLFRIPGVGLFGPTQAENWGFRLGPGIAVQGSGSMDSIGEQDVVDALEAVLANKNQREIRNVPNASVASGRCETEERARLSTNPVNWSRVATPQDDGYDTEVALEKAREERGWRTQESIESPSFCDGRVALRLWPFGAVPNPSLTPGPVEHPNILKAEEYVKTLWPVGFEQFARLVREVYPMTLSGQEDGKGFGSCSGQTSHRPFAIYTTHFDPFGMAESMLHEMAHVKLRCLGVQVESCSRIILNDPSELYESPLRAFQRPMTAVVHAFYSWLHLTELGVRLAAHDPKRAHFRLERNCQWIEQMLREIRSNVRLDEAGEQFFTPLYDWADRLLTEGRARAVELSGHAH